MLKTQLNLSLQQKLSPLQLQMIKMLEYPSVMMDERIREEMEKNPALEQGGEEVVSEENPYETTNDEGTTENIEWDDYTNDDEIPDYKVRQHNTSVDDINDDVIPFAGEQSFHEVLIDQLQFFNLNERQSLLAEYLIGNIGDDGYLRRDIESLEDDLAFQQSLFVESGELEAVLKVVQQFDPAGVGARDLKECLLLQLRRLSDSQTNTLAQEVLEKHFDQFSRNSYAPIMKRMHLTEDEMRSVMKEILKLNPKPGSSYAHSSDLISQRITPDFFVEEEEGVLRVRLHNSNVPDLKVSRRYKEMVQDYTGNAKNQTKDMKEALVFARQKIDSARWFIDAIKQRNNTLLRTMEAILKLQYDFFLTGDDTQLKPMKLKDIAVLTEYDISTISRVSNSKYVDTEFGIFSLKHFFSESMETESGEKVSNKEIKQIIQNIIDEEDKKHPITDEELTQELRKRGYKIARRTVAKYREHLHIPVARLRQDRL